MPQLPSNLREFDDTDKTRELLFDNTLEALKKRFPIEDNDYRLELSNVNYSGPKTYTLEQQKQALMHDRKLQVPIKGRWRLVHKPSNRVLDEREDTVMHVPYYTPRGTIIHKGNEYSVVNQSRLKPGAYVRKQRTGEIETHFNIRPGTGKSFRIKLQPETGVFYVNIGQSRIPMYTLLSVMGVSDKQLMKAWGPGLVEANIRAQDSRAVSKLYKRLSGYKYDPDLDDTQQRQYIKDSFPGYGLDPDVIASTMGLTNASGVTSDVLLRSTQKMLNVSRGEEASDDRDAPAFSNVLSIEDFMQERIEKDAGKLAHSLLYKAKRSQNLKPVRHGALNPYVQEFIHKSRLAMPLEETNPLHTLEQVNRIVKLGEGGISSAESITDEARDVNNGQFGFIDPIAGPEGCFSSDMEVMTSSGWITWPDVKADTVFACLVNGELEYHKAIELHKYEFSGNMVGAKSSRLEFLVTPQHRLWTRPYDIVPLKYRMEFAHLSCTKSRKFKCGGHKAHVCADPVDNFVLPVVTGGNATKNVTTPIPMDTWAEFMGWYLSEGSCTITKTGYYVAAVAQHDEENGKRIKAVLDRLPFKYQERRDSDGQLHGFSITRKQFGHYLHQFGKCKDKFIPEYFFNVRPEIRRILLETLLLGDGRRKRATWSYMTTSRQLASDVERLAFSLGYSVSSGFEPDSRSSVGGTFRVHLNICNERIIQKDKHWSAVPYAGYVYCATVPGGLMYVRRNGRNGHWSGNTNIGIDVRAAHRTFKGDDQQIYGEFRHPKTGHMAYLNPSQVANKVVAFPGEMTKPGTTVTAMVRGKVQQVSKNDVDLEVPSFGHMMSPNTNLNPLPTAVQPGRQFYASKYWGQYLPQVKGEVPLVDTLMPDGKSTYSEYYGKRIGTMRSKVGGIISRVTDQGVTVIDANGKKHVTELIRDFPFNRISGISYFPSVKKGDRVNVGDMLAHSNFTDKKTGAINMGINLKTAVIPAKGMSFEDAHVISESAAKKMSTERLYGYDVEARHGVSVGKSKYISTFPSEFTRDQIAMVDKNGIIKPGTTVQMGDPLILAVGPKLLTSADAQLGKLHKVLRNAQTDKSVTWEHTYPGVVTDIAMTQSGAKVNVKTTPPVQTGDKISSRFGLKGVIGKVMPDDQMPRDPATNEPYEMLLNPMTILSRVAPGQIVELALAKIAKKTGKQLRIPQTPPPEGWEAWAMEQLRQHGISEDAPLFDPETGKTIKPVGNGYMYVSAFHHLAEKKLSSRGEAGSYTIDEQPAKGGSIGSKRFCFTADQRIRVLGGEETIGHIVEQKQPVLAWAPNDAGKFGYYRVIDWFCRSGNVDEVLTIKVAQVFSQSIGKGAIKRNTKSLHVTKNHDIYTPTMQKVKAGSLKPGDWVAGYDYQVTDDQWSILCGSMLGDGSVGVDYTYSEMHSIKQKQYLDWKRDMLSLLVSTRGGGSCWKDEVTAGLDGGFTKTGNRKRVAYFNVSRPDITRALRDLFYDESGNKIIKSDLLKHLSDLAIAVWVLDDGWIGNHSKKRGGLSLQGNIATHSFPSEHVDMLVSFLNTRFGGNCTRNTVNAIYLDKHTCEQLVRVIASRVPAYAIPRSKKWLRDYVERKQAIHPPAWIDRNSELGIVPKCVLSVKAYVPPKLGCDGTINLYDIGVDTANRYCAGDIVVSNSSMDVNAALAHGATDVIKDVMLIRGTKNEDYWKALKLGRPLPEPKVPFIYDKFLNTLKAAGINVSEKGDTLSLMPLTDDDVSTLSRGAITSSKMITPDFEPVPGGLFDVGKTGGMSGNRWTHIPLIEPLPNPVMEEPIRRILGLRKQDLRDIITGQQELNGMTGGPAIQAALKGIDIDAEIDNHKGRVSTLRGVNRDNSVKVLGYLTALKKQGIHPSQWMITKVPVMPPIFRPVSRLGDIPLVADLNELYQNLIEANSSVEGLRKDLPETALAEEKGLLYDAVAAAFGLGEAITPEGRAKRLKGAFRQVIGTSPKCYDDATELLTRDGWVLFDSVDGSSDVATVNPVTGMFEWQRPQGVLHEPYTGKMVHTRTEKLDLLVTPNHEHWVERRRIRRGERTWSPAEKIEAQSLCGVTRRVRYFNAAKSFTGRKPTFGADPIAFAGFVGLWVAEGWLGSKNSSGSSVVYLCLSAEKHKEDIVAVDNLLTNLGIKYKKKVYRRHKDTKYYKRGYKFVYWSIANKELYNWLTENIGCSSGSKFLSRTVLGWDSIYLRELLQWYLFGDGERREANANPENNKTYYNRDKLVNRASRASTTSKLLVDSFAELCVKCGLGFKLCDTIEYDNPAWAVQYRFRVHGWDRTIVELPEQTQLIDYSGYVHCVQVQNGLLIVRRDGKTAVSGNSGMFQSKVISKLVDVVGRGVVTPDPNLDMDSLGIPEDSAWTLYKDFVIRRLVRRGYPPLRAHELVDQRSKEAEEMLQEEMRNRPVIMDRAPTWHKFNLMAFYPHVVKGKTIRVSPLVTSGFNMDFDGDQANFHVPVSDKAVDQARMKMLPSKNLFSLTDLRSVRHAPSMEMTMGLYWLTQKKAKKKPIMFGSIKDAKKAYREGKIGVNDPIVIVD